MTAGCGLVTPSARVVEAPPDTAPDGPVLEVARGETSGVGWSAGVYREGTNACFYSQADDTGHGSGCGAPPTEDRLFGPLTDGGDLAAGWKQVSGIVAPQVARVRILLRTGGGVDVETISVDETGIPARAFFYPLEPGADALAVVAFDGTGGQLGRFDFSAGS